MVFSRRRSLPFALATTLASGLVSGCATEGPFPSLAPREVERNVSLEEPVRTPLVVAAEPGLRSRAAELLALARKGERDFDAAYGPAARAAGRAGAAGSESWTVAQEAISRVEAARAETIQALADLDALVVARANQPTNAEDFETLTAAFEQAQRIAQGQQARLERLR